MRTNPELSLDVVGYATFCSDWVYRSIWEDYFSLNENYCTISGETRESCITTTFILSNGPIHLQHKNEN